MKSKINYVLIIRVANKPPSTPLKKQKTKKRNINDRIRIENIFIIWNLSIQKPKIKNGWWDVTPFLWVMHERAYHIGQHNSSKLQMCQFEKNEWAVVLVVDAACWGERHNLVGWRHGAQHGWMLKIRTVKRWKDKW